MTPTHSTPSTTATRARRTVLGGRIARTALAATTATVVALGTAGAAQAKDGSPCGRATTSPGGQTGVHYCPLTQGHVPVYNQIPTRTANGARKVVGYLENGGSANWFYEQFCLTTNGGEFHKGSLYNHWWGYTLADNGQIGFVPEVYFKGGGNNEKDAGLPVPTLGQC